MAQNIEVASLTAPIVVKIPTQKLEEFKVKLFEIADVLEFIVEQLSDTSKIAKRVFGTATKSAKKFKMELGKETTALKKSNKELDKKKKKVTRISRAYGYLAGQIAKLRVGIGLTQFALGGIMKLLVIPTTVFAGFMTMASMVNKTTSEMIKLSEATGFLFNDMRAIEMEAKSLGFTFEHVSSLVEELNNKLGGEAGGFVELNLQEGLAGLNMEARKLQGMKPPEQLEAIMNAASLMNRDPKNLALVASALDKIFGQEANRMMGAMSMKMAGMNVQWKEFLDNNKKISSISDEALAGAVAFDGFMNSFKTAMDTLKRTFFGDLGSKIAPYFETLSPVLETITSDIMEALSPEFMNKLTDGVITGIEMFLDVLQELKDKDSGASRALDSFIKGMKTMFLVGMQLFQMLKTVGIPTMEAFLWIVDRPIVRNIVAWTLAITAFGASMTAVFATGASALGMLIAKKKAFMALGPVNKVVSGGLGKGVGTFASGGAGLAKGAPVIAAKGLAITGAFLATYKGMEWLTNKTGYNDMLGGAMSGMFGSDSYEAKGRASELLSRKALALREYNRAKHGLDGTTNISSPTNNSTSTEIYNNTFNVTDEVTGSEILRKFTEPDVQGGN